MQKPELNGQEGTLVSYVAEDERWKVRMDDQSGKKLKTMNMDIIDGPVQESMKTLETHRAGDSHY